LHFSQCSHEANGWSATGRDSKLAAPQPGAYR